MGMGKKLLITSDLHQHSGKWDLLVKAAIREQSSVVLIAGDLLPKQRGIPAQRRFFPELRSLLAVLHDQLDAKVLLFLSNDDGHFLEPLVDDLEYWDAVGIFTSHLTSRVASGWQRSVIPHGFNQGRWAPVCISSLSTSPMIMW